MITVLIYPLADDQPAMFAQTFDHPLDAERYELSWRVLGHCRIERVSR